MAWRRSAGPSGVSEPRLLEGRRGGIERFNFLDQKPKRVSTITRVPLHRIKSGCEILAQIFEVFDAHRESHQRIVNAERRALFRGNRSVRHKGRVFDETFHSSETFCQGEQFRLFKES
jgi:hypothetical protein